MFDEILAQRTEQTNEMVFLEYLRICLRRGDTPRAVDSSIIRRRESTKSSATTNFV